MNPGFEEWDSLFSKTVPAYTKIANSIVHYWYNPTTGTPDCFSNRNEEALNKFPIENFGGKAQPHSGNSFGGFIPYSGKRSPEYREYITGQLSSTMEKGKEYTISFFVEAGARTKYGVMEIQLCFYPKFPGKIESQECLQPNSQMARFTLPEIKTYKGKWLQVTTNYISDGTEAFFIIGNFLRDADTGVEASAKITAKDQDDAYYYIDDFSISAEGEIKEKQTIEISEADTTIAKITGIAAGKKLVIDNVYFEIDESVLMEESFPVLDEIIAAMKDQPELNVVIDGHTDSDGMMEHNQKLSEERAKSVKAYFIAKGIASARITTNGFGSSRPVGADKNKNRRVEFTFSD
ncbi:MAG: OmpA family protein [Bacteroidia bacterium]